MMKGVIEFRNPLAGRYAVRTETGHYTVFQLLTAGVVLEEGEGVAGEFEVLALQSMHSHPRGHVNIFIEKARLTRAAAQAWVA